MNVKDIINKIKEFISKKQNFTYFSKVFAIFLASSRF